MAISRDQPMRPAEIAIADYVDQLDAFLPDISTISEQLAEINANINALDNRATTLEGDVSALDTRVENSEDDIISTNGSVSALANRTTQAEGNIAALINRTATIEGDVSALDTRVENSEDDISTLNEQISDTSTVIGQLNSELGAEITARENADIAINALISSINVKKVLYGYEDMTVAANSYVERQITFTEPFNTGDSVVVIPYLDSGSTSADIGSFAVVSANVNVSGFKLRVYNNSSNQRSPYARWVAIGY